MKISKLVLYYIIASWILGAVLFSLKFFGIDKTLFFWFIFEWLNFIGNILVFIWLLTLLVATKRFKKEIFWSLMLVAFNLPSLVGNYYLFKYFFE